MDSPYFSAVSHKARVILYEEVSVGYVPSQLEGSA
jgi:hypothetical protein